MKIYEILCWGSILLLAVLAVAACICKETNTALLSLILATMLEDKVIRNNKENK